MTAGMASTESDSQWPIESWSVDPTLRFDRIHVIEALGAILHRGHFYLAICNTSAVVAETKSADVLPVCFIALSTK